MISLNRTATARERRLPVAVRQTLEGVSMPRFRMLALAFPLAILVATVPEQPAAGVQKKGWYEKAVKKIEGKFDPAEAKPGQTVTFKLIVDLNDGYHTYPTVQPDKGAESFVNDIKVP